MAGSRFFLKIIVFTILALTYPSQNIVLASRLNVPRVLLPIFHDFPTNFTLEVTEGGCYRWSTTRLDVVHLIPTNENDDRTCSSAVIVQSLTRDPTRDTAVVFAEDINTGQLLRCVVIVDTIVSFNLVTTTRELFIEEAPEAFEVRAYDEQGNEFSTLNGVEFIWTMGDKDNQRSLTDFDQANSILRYMTFQESPYETPATVSMLDSAGKQGSIILLEGVKTGTVTLSAKLPYAEYKDVPVVEVELIVVANLIILPTDVTMMAYDSLKYKIMQVRQGRLEEILLPSDQYFLDAEVPTIVEIDADSGRADALAEGTSKVLLHDKNVNEGYGLVLPTAMVHVVAVERIAIVVLPDRNRRLIHGEVHEIIVELFDAKDHKFYIGEGVQVSVNVDTQYFDTKSVTQNGTHVVVVPILCGTTTVEAQLLGVVDKNGNKIMLPTPLVAKAELVINSRVKVNPRVLAVPWDPRSIARFDFGLQASGGDGAYVWSSRQPSVATVAQNGAVKIVNQGSTDIIVAMARNQYNNDRARVHVIPPSRLEIIQYNMEAATGELIYLHIALYGRLSDAPDAKEMAFTDCRNISLEVFITERNFVHSKSSALVPPVGNACTTLAVVGTNVGSSAITVTYNAGGHYIMDNVTVSAYEPLVPVHPSSATTLLTVGSSRKIIFKGGPHPWAGQTLGYLRKINVSESEVVSVSDQLGVTEVSVFEVTCRALGEAIVTFTISNEPLLPNCRSSGATATVRVICGKPRFIRLQPEFKDGKNCPIGKNPERIMAHTNQPLRLIVVVKDEDGKNFDNFTSLNIDWILNPLEAGIVNITSGVFEETIREFDVELPLTHYQSVIPKQHTGSLAISAVVTDYRQDVLTALEISPESPPFPISTELDTLTTPHIFAELNILLVNDTVISPSKLKILNDASGKYSLQVNQGSGYYEFVLSADDIADVRYVERTKTIIVVPKKAGTLQIALVDLCLASAPAIVEIEVQQLAEIQVSSLNKVERGKCIDAGVRLLDTNGNLIDLPSVEAFDLKSEVDSKHIEVKRLAIAEQGEPPYSQISYLIHGVSEGESKLSFSSGQEIRSELTTIQVFLPLKITQKNVTILCGTIFQITTTQGPPNTQIEFAIDDDTVAIIDNDGILEGKTIGRTRVTARAVGPDPQGNRIVYSLDHVDIHVIQMEGIRIVAPTTRIKVGATIPLWAFGVPDDLTPLIIGSIKSGLVFSWISSDSSLLYLHSMYEGTGINIRSQNEVTLRAKALKPGLATVHLNVTVPTKTATGYKKETTFNTFIKVEVIEELMIIHPQVMPNVPVILMTPNSSVTLRTNRDKHGVSTYKSVAAGSTPESEDSNALAVSRAISVDRNGVVKVGDILGRNILSVTNVESYNRKQTINVVVDVKPIHYIMLSLSTNVHIRDGEELNVLPKGMELNYIVEYFDDLGNKFHAGDVDFKMISSRADLLSFSARPENQVRVKFHENGELVAKIYYEKYPASIFDYAHMMIGDIIFPTKTVVSVGDVVCFSMPLLSAETGDPGFWQSSAPDVLVIDAVTGIGKAKNPGQTVVKHSLTSHRQGEIEVSVQPIEKISLVPLRGKNITGTEVFSAPLVLKSRDDKVKENNILSRGLGGCRTRSSFSLDSFPFTCTIQFASAVSTVNVKDIFVTKPRFDIVSGFYYCDIIPIGAPTMESSVVDARVQVNARSRDVEGKPLEVGYLPPVFVASTDVIFEQSSPQGVAMATVEIYGLPDILEHTLLEIPDGVAISATEYPTSTVLQCHLRLIQDREDIQGRNVFLINPLTRQNVTLVIRVPRHGVYTVISGISWLDSVYYHRYSLIAIAIVLITTFYIWKNRVTYVDMSVRNTSVFAEQCPPPLRKTPQPCSPGNTTINNSTASSPRQSPESPLRPFSAFEPVYGDPRGYYSPTRRNISFQCS